jgi:O-antigen ligase
LSILFLSIIVAGVFLSFSRGSWGAFVFSSILMIAAAYFTSNEARMKRRIAFATLVAAAVAIVVVLILLSLEDTRQLFLQRASVTQDYDEGSTGRFGNQMRSIPMLMERFGGFGPLRFRLVFDLEPHNSYIGAFANGGWIGGFLFILLVGTTCFIGFRLMFRASPYQRQAQVLFPSLLAFFIQAFQIDIDHWRHVLLMLGVIWGLEAARQKWEDAQAVRLISDHVQT